MADQAQGRGGTGGTLRVQSKTIQLQASRAPEFIDLTPDVRRFVAESGIRTGQVLVFCHHTTACIRINEHEPLLIRDLEDLICRVAPPDGGYRPDDFSVRTVNMTPDERRNGHAHCQSLLLGASETLPVVGGELLLGRWQSVFFVELDGARPREVTLQAIGID